MDNALSKALRDAAKDAPEAEPEADDSAEAEAIDFEAIQVWKSSDSPSTSSGRSGPNGTILGVAVALLMVVAVIGALSVGGDPDTVSSDGDDVALAGDDEAATAPGDAADMADSDDMADMIDMADSDDMADMTDMDDMADMDHMVEMTALPNPLPGPPLDLTVASAEFLAPQTLDYRRWLLENPDLALTPAIAMANTPASDRINLEVAFLDLTNRAIQYDNYHIELFEIHSMGEGIGFHMHESYTGMRVVDRDTGAVVEVRPPAIENNYHLMFWPQPDGQWLLGIMEEGTMEEGMNHARWLEALGGDPNMDMNMDHS